MQLNSLFDKVFDEIPILGMIHLAGDDPVQRAIDEMAIYAEEGVDGAIIENYHGSVEDVIKTLEMSSSIKPELVLGVNILPNEFKKSFQLAHKYGADFIQIDHVAGKYCRGELDFESYSLCKEKYSDIIVLGGVWPKYYTPIEGSDLERDLVEGKSRVEAVVVTGIETGVETPLEKIKRFREIIGDHHLVVGAGMTVANAYEQLYVSDGAIVGSYFKKGGVTRNMVDRDRVRDFMAIVRKTRKERTQKIDEARA